MANNFNPGFNRGDEDLCPACGAREKEGEPEA
jgi:hypothetical protein